MNEDNKDLAVQIFCRIQELFPNLKMEFDLEPEHVDVNVDIPKQEGLLFDVNLNLQNLDELHFSVGSSFWLEWFPCSDEKVSQQYFEAVSGVLSGNYRILEHHRGKKVVKAQLQRPDGSGWKTIGTHRCLHLPFPFKKTTTMLRNAQ